MTDEQQARLRQALLLQRKRARRGRHRRAAGVFAGRYLGLQVLPPDPRPWVLPDVPVVEGRAGTPSPPTSIQPQQEGTTR